MDDPLQFQAVRLLGRHFICQGIGEDQEKAVNRRRAEPWRFRSSLHLTVLLIRARRGLPPGTGILLFHRYNLCCL
jgi:hypothetical protein